MEKRRAQAHKNAEHGDADENPKDFHKRYYRQVPLEIAVGRRVFAPSWLMTVATLCLLTLFIGLGRWQWDRAATKELIVADFERANTMLELGTTTTRELPAFAKVSVRGVWDSERQFLLDNRTRDGRAGYEVLTPLQLPDGRWLLVNRGWLAFEGYRDRLPDVASSLAGQLGEVEIRGRLGELPSYGLAGGRAAPARVGPWPRVTSFPQTSELAEALAGDGQTLRLESRVLLLDDAEPAGFLRQWQPFAAGKGPEQNWGYAIQWWSFAVLLLVLYFTLNLRKRV